MPISPAPPSGGNTSSSEARMVREFRSRRPDGDGRRVREHIPRRDSHGAAVGQAQHQAAGLVEGFETTGEFALRKTHAHALAHTRCAREPVGAYGRKTLAGIPLRL